MFALPAVTISAKHRASGAHFLSEVIASAPCDSSASIQP